VAFARASCLCEEGSGAERGWTCVARLLISSPHLTLPSLTELPALFTDPVYGLAVVQPRIHFFAYGVGGLLTYIALFLYPGSFFLLLPLLFLALTGASCYRRLYSIDPSLRGMLLGSCTIVSLFALVLPLLVWIVGENILRNSENGDGNDVSGRWSDFDGYPIGESLPISKNSDTDAVFTSPTVISTIAVMICQRLSLLRIAPLDAHAFLLSSSVLHSALISALARLDIALARSKAARRPLFVDLAPSTPSYDTLPPLKETPFEGGPTGPRLVVPGLTPSSLRLGLYTMVGLLSTTLLVVAAPGLCSMFFVSSLPFRSVLLNSRLTHSHPSIIDQCQQIRGIPCCVSICSGPLLTSVCNALFLVLVLIFA
jgi:hypothetical protein